MQLLARGNCDVTRASIIAQLQKMLVLQSQ